MSSNSLGMFDNVDELHNYRVLQTPGQANQYFVWRDGQLLNLDGAPLESGIDFPDQARLVFGDGGAPFAGSVELDFVRFTEGAFLPGPALELLIAKTVDIGPDRIGVEGKLQTFSMPPASNHVYVWSVLGPNTTLTNRGDTFEFTPEDQGDFQVTVTRLLNDSGTFVPIGSDELLLRVLNAPQRQLFRSPRPRLHVHRWRSQLFRMPH